MTAKRFQNNNLNFKSLKFNEQTICNETTTTVLSDNNIVTFVTTIIRGCTKSKKLWNAGEKRGFQLKFHIKYPVEKCAKGVFSLAMR